MNTNSIYRHRITVSIRFRNIFIFIIIKVSSICVIIPIHRMTGNVEDQVEKCDEAKKIRILKPSTESKEN